MMDKNALQTVKDGEYPFYEKDDSIKPIDHSISSNVASSDADTIQGISAVTAKVGGPNKLVATGKTGTLPTGVVPVLTSSFMTGGSGSFTTGGHTYTVVNGVITVIA